MVCREPNTLRHSSILYWIAWPRSPAARLGIQRSTNCYTNSVNGAARWIGDFHWAFWLSGGYNSIRDAAEKAAEKVADARAENTARAVAETVAARVAEQVAAQGTPASRIDDMTAALSGGTANEQPGPPDEPGLRF